MSDLLTIKEAAGYLRMSPLTVYRLASKGKMPATTVGRHWRIHQDALEAWLRPGFPHRTYYILVVDDDADNLESISTRLEELGFRTLVAASAKRGLESALHGQPDLILLDVVLPGMDGLQVCRRLKADEATRDIPVILMSARPRAVIEHARNEAGADGILEKETPVPQIIEVIGSFLSGRLKNGPPPMAD